MRNESDILAGMEPITLEEMDSIRLMNRTDTKFLTDRQTLLRVLEMSAVEGYRVFEISGNKVQGYRSMYFDTPELRMYLDHHNRRLVRQKLRTRTYEDSGQTFLELKTKNNHGRTKKKRIRIAPEHYLTAPSCVPEEAEWLGGRLGCRMEGLAPSLETVFSRITLVNPEKTERTTIDFELRFNNLRHGTAADLGNLVIIELKQDGNLPSRFRDILLECRVKPFRISKYCIGTALTDNEVRSGRFKTKIMKINKLKTQI